MGIYKDFVIFIIGILIIVKSADFFTSGAEGMSIAFRIPRVIIGLTIVSLATRLSSSAIKSRRLSGVARFPVGSVSEGIPPIG